MKELVFLLMHFNFHKLFKEPTHNTFIQFFRYIFVGGAATVADWGVLFLLETLHPEWLYFSVAVAFCSGLTVNYLFSKKIVFPLESGHNKLTEFAIYLITGLIGLGFTELFMFILVGKINLHYMMSKIITTVVVFGWNFGSKKLILYRKRHFK